MSKKINAEAIWIIRGPVENGERLYWSNSWGWTSIEEGDHFTNNEKEMSSLPVDGEWISV